MLSEKTLCGLLSKALDNKNKSKNKRLMKDVLTLEHELETDYKHAVYERACACQANFKVS